MLMGLGVAMICAPAALASCGQQKKQVQPKLTQWVAAEDNWFIGANWDKGVPTSVDTARVDNAGIADISACGAAAQVLQIGYSLPGSGVGEGTVNLYSGGTLSVGNAEYLGVNGAGTFYQFGGSHCVSCGSLTLAQGAQAAGTYYLNDGSLTVKSGTIIAQMGSAAFYQESGTNKIECGALTIAQGAGSDGSYELDGGMLSVSGDENIGLSGSASFDQFGGTNNANCGTLYVAKDVESASAYAIYDGTLRVGDEVLGDLGISAFGQYGGANIVSGSLTAGTTASGSGAYYLGDGVLTVGGNESWGAKGVGVYYQDGGSHSIASTLTIGGAQNSLGDFEIQTGTLAAKDVLVGTLGSEGLLGIYGPDPIVTVGDTITLGPDGWFSAVDGATIHMTGACGAFRNTSTNELALDGLEYLYVIFEGGVKTSGSCNDGNGSCGSGYSGNENGCGSNRSCNNVAHKSKCSNGDSGCGQQCNSSDGWATFEVAGKNMGCTTDGFVQNFTLNGLFVGGAKAAHVKLLDVSNNGNRSSGHEALYAHEVVVTKGSTLDMNGLNVYCDGTVDIQGTVLNGTVTLCPDPPRNASSQTPCFWQLLDSSQADAIQQQLSNGCQW